MTSCIFIFKKVTVCILFALKETCQSRNVGVQRDYRNTISLTPVSVGSSCESHPITGDTVVQFIPSFSTTFRPCEVSKAN